MRGLDLAAAEGLLPGEVLAITGPEGAGKSRLARHLIARWGPHRSALIETSGLAIPEPSGWEELLISRVREERAALSIASELAGCGALELVVIDALGGDELSWQELAEGLRALGRAGAAGACRVAVVGRAEPFGGVPLGLSLGTRVRLDLGSGPDRLVVRDRGPIWLVR